MTLDRSLLSRRLVQLKSYRYILASATRIACLSRQFHYNSTTMGSTASKASSSSHAIDGMGLEIPPSYGLPRPTPESLRKLNQLLKGNHFTYGFLFNNKAYHNHTPYHLISAYFLGATPDQLTEIFEDNARSLVPWKEDSPAEVTDQDWREHRGKKIYERGWNDYFTDKVSEVNSDDWVSVARSYFYEQNDNMFIGLFGGLLHPLIHLGYAVEMDNYLLAIEALGMSGTEYENFFTAFDRIGIHVPESQQTSDPLEILNEIRNDKELNGKVKVQQQYLVQELIDYLPEKIAYYRERLHVPAQVDAATAGALLRTGALLLTATHKDNDPQFDFFLLHVLTSTHEACEICLSPIGCKVIPPERHRDLIRGLWTVVICLYIDCKRPLIKPALLDSVSVDSPAAAWKVVVDKALNGRKRFDSHHVKALRALMFAHLYTGDEDQLFTRAAYHYAVEFESKPTHTGRDEKDPLDVVD